MSNYLIGDYIRDTRLRRGYTQEQLSFGICTTASLSRIETGAQAPGKHILDALMERLGIGDKIFDVLVSKEDMVIFEKIQDVTRSIARADYDQLETQIEALEQLLEKKNRSNLYLQYLTFASYMEQAQIEGSAQEKKLYDLIWKRTIASQMADAELEKTTATISISNASDTFNATGEVVKFDGFLRVYRESYDDDVEQEDESRLLPPLKKGQKLQYQNITATERFTQHPPRYTEASLVRKLEELGIGRPSTYAPTISTVQQREYVEKGDKTGEERLYNVITLKEDKIADDTRTEITGAEKAKLLPTDTGTVVTDFLMQYFPSIMDYNFTASVEKQFDEIAEGDTKWTTIMKTFYKTFHPSVESTLAAKNAHKTGERLLGDDPVSGKPVSVKIGRFGPVVQIGTAEDEEKPRFSPLKKGMSIETITLEEAMELFKLPRTLGEHEGKTVSVNAGRFGPYIYYNGTYTSLPKGADPMEIELEEALELIKEKAEAEAKKHLKKFEEEPELEIMNGRYGPYIAYKGNNYKIPKDIVPEDLSLDACLEIVKLQSEKAASAPAKPKRGRYAKKKA